MITIFRYQDDEGRGPFKPGMADRWLVDHESKPIGLIEMDPMKVRRAIYSFAKLNRGEHHFGFGCKSLDDLFQWFIPDERKRLKKLGYQIVSVLGHQILGNESEILFSRRLPLAIRAVILSIE